MALIVEDGTAKIDSESYVTTSETAAYFTARGNTVWAAATTDAQEAALRRATEWIDRTYRTMFVGYRKLFRDQALEWPRTGAYIIYQVNTYDGPYRGGFSNQSTLLPDTEIPPELKKATMEAAWREMKTPGVLTPDIIPGKIIKSVAVSGAVSVTYADGSVKGQYTIVSIIGEIIAPLLASSGLSKSPLFGHSQRAN